MTDAAPQRETNGLLVPALLGLFVVVYLMPLGLRPLAAPDEVRYAEIAREMIVSGDWVSPHLNGVRYFEKPVLGHWLNAGSFELLGMNAFALRLPSALAAGLTALLVFWLTRHFVSRRAALLASAIYATMLLVFGVGTFAVLDTYLALFLTAALAFFYRAYRCDDPTRRRMFQILCGVACGAAFLTKGFLGLVIPAIVVAPFLVLRREWRALLTQAWLPLIAALAVSLPWSILIHLREPDFWRYFVVIEHLQRFLGQGEAVQHAAPWWLFLAALPLIGLPWIVYAPQAAGVIWRAASNRAFLLYLGLWFLLPFAFFSASQGKLLTYVLPCFAPLAMLLAVGLERVVADRSVALARWPAAVLAALFGGGVILLLAAQGSLVDEPVYGSDETAALLSMMGALAFGCVMAIGAMLTGSSLKRLALFGSAVLPLFVAISFALPARILDDKAPVAFLRSQGPFDADTLLVADAALFGTTCWALERDDVYVLGGGEVAYGMSFPDARSRALDAASLQRLLTRHSDAEIILFIKEGRERALSGVIPANALRTQRGELIVWRIGSSRGRTVG
jgi:4-amino-4-deoxy-L-arabinose transferase